MRGRMKARLAKTGLAKTGLAKTRLAKTRTAIFAPLALLLLSLAVITGLLLAIAFFLAVHRRTDKGDRKLAAARRGPEVARFR